MKAETARLLRAVLRLVEDDVRDLSECVAEIDDREADHHAYTVRLGERVTALEFRLMRAGVPGENDNHSVKA